MNLQPETPSASLMRANHKPTADQPTWPYRLGAAALGALALSALVYDRLARKAERDNPPLGLVLDVNGVRLHVVERGQGKPLVLLHGNGSMIEDFVSSGLVDAAARTRRVIVFDRPGYGHSERPRTTVWSPEAQADLIAAALTRLGAAGVTMLGHSWGCLVAVALARRHPTLVGGLVLVSGYYYPSVRGDVVGASLPTVPIVGDVLRHTVMPLVTRASWPLAMRKVFGPAPVPAKFAGFPKEMAVRPSQIRASAAESALMIPSAARSAPYADLAMPVTIVAGAQDRMVDVEAQSARLHKELAQSTFDRIEGAGHMVHQTATDLILAAIDRIDAPASNGREAVPAAM
jgi:pimeloyl-ACP methyl ester carboxylesterase